MKRHNIIFVLALILILSCFFLPKVGYVENYDSTKLSELKMMAKKNNKKALNELLGYYSLKHYDDNVFLIRCATYQGLTENEKIHIYKNAYIDDRDFLEKECPSNPIDKIKDRDSFVEKIRYFLKFWK